MVAPLARRKCASDFYWQFPIWSCIPSIRHRGSVLFGLDSNVAYIPSKPELFTCLIYRIDSI